MPTAGRTCSRVRRGPTVTMRLTDRSLYLKLFLNPELHAGEAYMDGRMCFEELDVARLPDAVLRQSAFAREPAACRRRCGGYRAVSSVSSRPIQSGKAQRNVAHHYDLGNEFYKLFLDEGMQYSCAYFLDDSNSLEEAQKKQAAADRCQVEPEAGSQDPRYRQRLGRPGAVSGSHGGRQRHRCDPVTGAACVGKREGARLRPRRQGALRTM